MAYSIALALSMAIGIINAPFSQAQSQAGPKPSFEVASIKLAEKCGQFFSPSPGKMMAFMGPSFLPGGRYSGCNTLKSLIVEAYKSEASRVSGGPDWANSVAFQIDARASGPASTDEMRLMLQSLLEERFKLKIRRELREMSVYALVVAKGGPKLQPAKDENGNPIAKPPEPPSPEELVDKMKTAMRGDFNPKSSGVGTIGIRFNGDQAEFFAKAVSMDKLADSLINNTGRKIINKTGINGLYDIEVRFAGEGKFQMGPMPVTMNPSTVDPATPSSPVGPSLLNALQKQLGLKLEPDKAQFEYITIDSVEKPSEN